MASHRPENTNQIRFSIRRTMALNLAPPAALHSPREVLEQVVHHERGPHDGLKNGPDVGPEALGVLPVVDECADQTESVDGTAPRGRPLSGFRTPHDYLQ